jgi:hypothetical protein
LVVQESRRGNPKGKGRRTVGVFPVLANHKCRVVACHARVPMDSTEHRRRRMRQHANETREQERDYARETVGARVRKAVVGKMRRRRKER